MFPIALFSLFAGALALPATFEASVEASLKAQLATSPLTVQLEESGIPGVVLARITNRGLDTAYFSTWRNPLSEDDLSHKLEVLTANKEPVQFLNPQGLPVTEDIPLEESVKLAAGTTVTRLIDVADNYDLEPQQQYIVQSEGFIPYRLEGESSWTRSAAYQTNEISFQSSEDVHDHDHAYPEVAVDNRMVFKGCDDAQFTALVKRSVEATAVIAKTVSEKVAAGKNKEAFMAYFKVDNPEVRKQVADRYMAMHTTLSGKDNKSTISCRAACNGYYAIGAAWTGPADGSTFFCPAMKSYPEKLTKCVRMNWPGVIMHELSHNAKLYKPGTLDTAQGGPACKKLSAAQAIKNADTFNMFGQSMYLDTVC